MEFQCVCGQTLSAEAAPGTVVQCGACGETIRVPAEAGVRAERAFPYGAQAAAGAARTSGLAIGSLVCGAASILVSFLATIPAVVLGIVALVQIGGSRGRLKGKGLAVAGIVMGMVLWLVPVLVVAPRLRGGFRRLGPPPRRTARAVQCANHIRNINLAVFQYTVGSNDELPPADHNICLALGVHMGDATDDNRGGPYWRCPSDRFIPEDRVPFWCSYAPNASVEETDEVIGCFSSNAALSNRIGNVAPDTISFVEMWTPPNVVPGHPGFELRLDATDPANVRRSMVTPGAELVAIRSYRTARPVKFDSSGRLTDCGNYLFLRAFMGERLEDMYHDGRINVSFIDGHVETMWIKDLIKSDRPADDPRWTRDPD